MAGKRDSIRKAASGWQRDPCPFGCRAMMPASCEVIDPFTVRMVARCPRCGSTQGKIGSLRGVLREGLTAEGFADAFMRGLVGGARG